MAGLAGLRRLHCKSFKQWSFEVHSFLKQNAVNEDYHAAWVSSKFTRITLIFKLKSHQPFFHILEPKKQYNLLLKHSHQHSTNTQKLFPLTTYFPSNVDPLEKLRRGKGNRKRPPPTYKAINLHIKQKAKKKSIAQDATPWWNKSRSSHTRKAVFKLNCHRVLSSSCLQTVVSGDSAISLGKISASPETCLSTVQRNVANRIPSTLRPPPVVVL